MGPRSPWPDLYLAMSHLPTYHTTLTTSLMCPWYEMIVTSQVIPNDALIIVPCQVSLSNPKGLRGGDLIAILAMPIWTARFSPGGFPG